MPSVDLFVSYASRDRAWAELARRRRVLGDDHPDTLATADNLAIGLRELGDEASAVKLESEVRRRQAEQS